MTVVRIIAEPGAFDPAAQARLAEAITRAVAEVETGQDNRGIRRGIMVQFHDLAAQGGFFAGLPAADGGKRVFHLDAIVMAGPWNGELKSALSRRCAQAIVDELHVAIDDVVIWMTIAEVADGGWSVNGVPVTIGALRPFFLPDRQQRIDAYLAGRG